MYAAGGMVKPCGAVREPVETAGEGPGGPSWLWSVVVVYAAGGGVKPCGAVREPVETAGEGLVGPSRVPWFGSVLGA